MTANDGARYRKVSLDADLASAVEDMIQSRPETARNLSRFVDDAVRSKLQDLYSKLPTTNY